MRLLRHIVISSLAFLASTCTSYVPGPRYPLTVGQQETVHAAYHLWMEAGLPPVDEECDPRLLQIAVLESRDFKEICGGSPCVPDAHIDGCRMACFVCSDGGGYEDMGSCEPLLVIGEGQPDRLWKHELMHWMAGCSGIGIEMKHGDPRVWHRVLPALYDLSEAG